MTPEESCILDGVYEKARLLSRYHHPTIRFHFRNVDYKIGCIPGNDGIKWLLAPSKSNYHITIKKLSPESIFDAIQQTIIREIHNS
jgi:hypothetical protein